MYFLGIDLSKLKLDLSLFDGEEELFNEKRKNEIDSIEEILDELIDRFQLNKNELLICAEYTGNYSYPLVRTALKKGLNLWIENPATIKWSSGVQRGKSDKIDAKRLAIYAFRFQDKARLVTVNDPIIDKLKYLQSERELLVADRAKYLAQIKDQPNFMPRTIFEEKKKRLDTIIKSLSKAIKIIEEQVKNLINQTTCFKEQMEIMTSINGVGDQLATYMLIATEGFRKFNNPRQFCCYAGIAPFRYTSGTSQRSKSKISHRADKKAKKLLHMAALSSVKSNHEMKIYFNRKVKEGKNKMTVLNAVRAKIVHLIFALIRENRKYDHFYINQFA